MVYSNKSVNNTKFIENLNGILSAENAAIERLHKRIQETPIQDPKKILQQHIQEQKEQQSRLENLIADYDRKPTNSKADLLSLNSLTKATNDKMKNNNNTIIKSTTDKEGHEGNNNNKTAMTAKEVEILNTKEDSLIKKDEILAYKTILKIAEEITAEDTTINILKQNLQEKESMYNKIKSSESKMLNEIGENNNRHESFKLGSAVADLLTSYWNSKENPSKVYIFNRRVHHGAIGAFLGLSTLYKKNPIATGILSGLGAGLQKDDYNDFKEWFLFKKKEDDDTK
jgi:ferritin-like metal-binding protein YciE